VVIEHNMDFIMKLCPHVICMVEGKVLAALVVTIVLLVRRLRRALRIRREQQAAV